MKTIEGKISGKGKKIAILVSRFNSTITQRLLDGAVDTLTRHEVNEKDITVAFVPGAFELPPTAKRMAAMGVDAVLCLGCVIRGSTPHFDFVAGEVAKGIAKVAMKATVPVIYGVLTTDTIEQALERSGTKAGNRGHDAAMAALEMCGVYAQIQG